MTRGVERVSAAADQPHPIQQDAGLGLEVDVTAVGLQITRIGRGAARSYNASAPEAHRICKHDLIVMVNGTEEPSRMAARLAEDKRVTMKIWKLERKLIRIDRKGGDWGMTLLYHEVASSCLLVKEIAEGVVDSHNLSADPDARVFPKDFIASVNGKSGRGLELLHELKSANAVELVLLRKPT